MQGKHENDYYTIGKSKYVGGTCGYYVYWLKDGVRSCGFTSPEEARRNADRIADRMEIRNKGVKI